MVVESKSIVSMCDCRVSPSPLDLGIGYFRNLG